MRNVFLFHGTIIITIIKVYLNNIHWQLLKNAQHLRRFFVIFNTDIQIRKVHSTAKVPYNYFIFNLKKVLLYLP